MPFAHVKMAMCMKNALEILCESFARESVDFMLIGGFALAAHGVVRQTMDVDCLIDEADSGSADKALTGCGYRQGFKADSFVKYEHQSGLFMDIDVMLVDEETFGKMRDRSSIEQIGDADIRVPSVSHLLALKLHAVKNNPRRELKDLGDAVELLRHGKDVVPRDELREICERYGPEGVFERLEGYL